MKKACAIFLMMLFLLLSGCIASKKNTVTESSVSTYEPSALERNSISDSSTNSDYSNVIVESSDYSVVALYGGERTKYHCSVFNKKHDVMYDDTILFEPKFVRLDNGMLELTIGYNIAAQKIYFDTNKNLISPTYQDPILLKYNKIVYMTYDGQYKLIVSDLFDKKLFYKEYKRDFAIAVPFHDITNAEFINSSKLKVSYLTGSEYKEVTETIDLNK